MRIQIIRQACLKVAAYLSFAVKHNSAGFLEVENFVRLYHFAQLSSTEETIDLIARRERVRWYDRTYFIVVVEADLIMSNSVSDLLQPKEIKGSQLTEAIIASVNLGHF